MNGLTSEVARILLGLMIACATLVSTDSSASATEVKYAYLVSGNTHSCGVLNSGSIKCWGSNSLGELGLGYTSDSVSSPTLVPGLTDVVSLVSGGSHMCARLASGSVKCWGYNYMGQLGLGYTSDSVSTPTLVPGLIDVVSLVSGNTDTCALLNSGSVKCWGYNYMGQLGLGYTSDSVSTPTLVPGLTDVVSLVSGGSHTCAVLTSGLTSGSVKCWGYNYMGQLGFGNTRHSPSTPAFGLELTGASSLVLGGYHSCAVLVSGSVKCWGYNSMGQLGFGYTSDSVSTPTLVPGLTDVAYLDLGTFHTCAVLVSGSAKCWGYNTEGQLGLGYTSNSVSTPTLVPGLADVVSLVSGGSHMCAVLVSGSVKCWGANSSSQLGLGDSSQSVSSPTLVPGLTIQRVLRSPTSLAAASVGATSVALTFASPADVTADDPITDFEYSLDDGTTWVTPNVSFTSSPLTLNGLAHATAYAVKIRAVNSQGPGAASESISVTTLAIPASEPVINSVLAGNQQATFGFMPPLDDGGAAITNYEYSTDSGSSWIAVSPAQITSPIAITGLMNGTTNSVKLRAVNAVGSGAASDAVFVTPRDPSGILLSAISSGEALAKAMASSSVMSSKLKFTSNLLIDNSRSPLDAYNEGSSDVLVSGHVLSDLSRNSIQVPVSASTISVITKIPKIQSIRLDAATLSAIFKGTITMWDDARIKTLNKSVKLPRQSIRVHYQSGDADTSKTFFDFLDQTTNDSWSTTNGEITHGSGQVSAVGVAHSSGAELVAAMASDSYSLGYVQTHDVVTGVNVASIKNAAGGFMKPSVAAGSLFLKGAGVLTPSTVVSGTYDIDYTKSVKNAYPLTHLVYMAAPMQASSGGLKAKQMLTYLNKHVSVNPNVLKLKTHIPLPARVITAARTQIATMN